MNLIKTYPIKIHRILTDNGSEFTYKLLPKKKQTQKEHPFDEVCRKNGTKHKLIKFKHPWTNGQVERFNGLMKNGTTKKCRYKNLEEMIEDIKRWVIWYNGECKLKSLKRMTPNQAVQISLSNSVKN